MQDNKYVPNENLVRCDIQIYMIFININLNNNKFFIYGRNKR